MMRLLRPALIATATLTAAATPAAAADRCLGEPCPYNGASQIGQSGGGVMRFPQAIAVSPSGQVYVGDQNSRIVQVFDQEGNFLRQFGTPGTRPGELTAVSSITATPADRIALTDGGTNRVLIFTADGRLYRTIAADQALGQFRFGAGGGNDMPAGGALHHYKGVIYVADSSNDRVIRMNAEGGEQSVFVPTGQLAHPRGIAARGDLVVIADDQNHRLAVYGRDGSFVRSVGLGKGAGPGQLSYPFGVAMDTMNRVFVADDMNQRVVRFGTPPSFKYLARWGSYGTAPGQLAYPRAIATDEQGRVYITNTGNDRIDVFSNTGTLIRSFGRSGRAPGQFNTPSGVAADSSGVRAVTDAINGRVQLLGPDGSVLSIWGSPNPGPTILRRPVDVVFDDAGNGYVLDQSKAQIVRFDRATALPAGTFGAPGSGPGQLLAPSALARSADGRIWVADTGNSRVAIFGADGSAVGSLNVPESPRGIAVTADAAKIYVSTNRNRVLVFDAAGTQTAKFGFGPGSKLGQLNAPADLSLDAAGSIWIADRGNNRIAHFSSEGKRLGTFGSRGSGEGAQFSGPTDVAVDCRGTLTVSDTRNNVVRAFTLATPAAGQACGNLPAPGQPPALQYPVLPAPDGPLLTARVLRKTSLVSRGLAVRVSCDTTCTLNATGTISQVGLPPKRRGIKRRPVSVPTASAAVTIESGRSKVIRLSLSAAEKRRLLRALGRQRAVRGSVALSATAAVGRPTTESVSIPGTR